MILTCVCGIADDAGYNLIKVERKTDIITWHFRDESSWNWQFEIHDYYNEIRRINNEIMNLNPDIKLEPRNVIFPEE